MKTLLICPDEVLAVRALTQNGPPATIGILGKPLIAYWIEHLISLGAQEVLILSADRPHKIREIVQEGCPWGIKVEVLTERHEPTIAKARAKFITDSQRWLASPYDVIIVNGLPNAPTQNLFETFENYFEGVLSWLPHAIKNRVHMKERAPGIWISSLSRVPNSATIKAPCWIGDNVRVGEGVILGPMAIVEENVVIGRNVLITNSIIKADTYLGEMIDVQDSIATGNLLINWKSNSLVTVPDAFLISDLAHKEKTPASTTIGRLAAAIVALATAPMVLPYAIRSLLRGTPLFDRLIAVAKDNSGFVTYYQLRDAEGYFRRWPQLWNIVSGEFAWFGNRPLSVRECAEMTAEFETLWLESGIGLFSQADASGCWTNHTDEAVGHAAFYAAQHNGKLNGSILKGIITTWRSASEYTSCLTETQSITDRFFDPNRAVPGRLSH